MANYDRESEDFSASRAYEVKIALGHIEWTVKHRYSEFHDLHEKLVAEYRLDKSLLPPKRYMNKSESFIKKRQKQLEVYLQTVLRNFVNVPSCLATFLNFNQYEIHGITQELALQLFQKGDQILEAGEMFYTTPLQLYSICSRLKLAQPTCDSGDKSKDIGHILAFITQLKFMRIDGTSERHGTSNIVTNQLAFHLQNFKSLEKLQIVSCNPSRLSGIENVKKSLVKLQVKNSLKALKELLLLDMGFGQWLGNSEESVLVPAWHNVQTAVFSKNDITYIDESVKLLPKVKYLDLSHNKLHEVQELQHLPHLTHVDLSYNALRQLHALHTKFGNIKSLNIAGNNVQSFQGFSKLYSLESLDVKSNDISQVAEIEYLGSLPCLEILCLTNNPVTMVVDYRNKVLEVFKDRAKELLLDGRRATQKELDTVAVLIAIQKSRQTIEKKHTKLSARQASISDPSEASSSTLQNTDSATEVTEDPELYPCRSVSPSPPPSTSAQSSSQEHHSSSAAPSSDAHATGASSSGCDRESEVYRSQVENMRTQGGTAWLTLLNSMEEKQNTEQEIKKERKERAHSYRYHYDEKQKSHSKKKGRIKTSATESDSSTTDESSVEEAQDVNFPTYQMYSEANFMLPESMPSRNDSTFLTHLQVMTPDTQALSRRSGVGGQEGHNRDERPVHLMWAPAIQYSSPYKEFPACIYITTENIHIFEVKALTSDFEVPEMLHVYCIPLMNVQQIALGYKNLYIRIEEAFVGPSGTFTFLTCNAGKTDLFLDSLKLAYRRAVPDFDQYEDPHVVVNENTEANLKQVLAKVEQVKEDKVQILMYMLINMCDPEMGRKKCYTCHTLVITSRCLCVLREDYIFWPQPTFSIGPSTRPQFEVVAVFPIHSRIAEFQMYDSDTCSPEQNQSLASTFSATNTSAMLTPNFLGYGVRLIFDLGGASGATKELDIRASTSNVRHKFLEALTSARGRMTETSSQKVRFHLRDSDRSSESTSSSGKVSKSKKRVKSKYAKDKLKNSSRCEEDNPAKGKEDAVKQKVQRPPNLMSVLEQSQENDAEAKLVKALTNLTTDSLNLNSESNTDRPINRDSPTGESSNTIESVEESYFAQMAGQRYSPDDTHISDESRLQPKLKLSPPKPLPLGYPSMELLGHLTACNEDVRISLPMSDSLCYLSNMTGEEILNYFHSHLGQIGKDGEELRHLLWTEVVPFVNPRQAIVTCVMVSTCAIYLVSNDFPKQSDKMKPSWRKHVRYQSDTAHFMKKSVPAVNDNSMHHMSGIVHKTGNKSGHQKKVKAYCVLPLKEISCVNIGLFDHSFRISGSNAENVYCCVTRDHTITESFARHLMAVLSLMPPMPSPQTPDLSVSGSEQDFYKMFKDRSYNRSLSDSLEYVHPSKVRFIYTNDDVVADLIYVIRENMKGNNPKDVDPHILSYILCYKQKSSSAENMPNCPIDVKLCDPRTVVLTEKHLTLIVEDYVSYPLPNFAKEPPMHKQHVILEVRSLVHLKRVLVSDFTSHDLTLIFSDESEEVCVDSAFEYYTPSSGMVAQEGVEFPEVTWTLVIQTLKDKDRFINLLCMQWGDLHDGQELSVQVNA